MINIDLDLEEELVNYFGNIAKGCSNRFSSYYKKNVPGNINIYAIFVDSTTNINKYNVFLRFHINGEWSVDYEVLRFNEEGFLPQVILKIINKYIEENPNTWMGREHTLETLMSITEEVF